MASLLTPFLKWLTTRSVKMGPGFRGRSGRIRFKKQPTLDIPVSFGKKTGKPFEQTFHIPSNVGWTSRGEAWSKPAMRKGGAKTLPKGSVVGPHRLKGPLTIGAVGALGIGTGYLGSKKAPSSLQKQAAVIRNMPKIITPKVTKAYRGTADAGAQHGRSPAVLRKSTPAVTTRKKPQLGTGAQHGRSPVNIKVPQRIMHHVPKPGAMKVEKSPSKAMPRSITPTKKMIEGRIAGKAMATKMRNWSAAEIAAHDKAERNQLAGKWKAAPKGYDYSKDLYKKQASGYHIYKKGSRAAKEFQAKYKAAKGKRFYWGVTGKWYK